MTVYMVLAIAALAVLFWPASKSEPVLTIGPAVPASPRKQTYRS